MTGLSFIVMGVPAPAGSKRAFMVKGRPVIANTNDVTQKQWRLSVTSAANDARLEQNVPPFTGPVDVAIEFVLPRPASARKHQVWKTTKPDIDKLLRSTLDGLTDAAVFTDDALVCKLWSSKRLASAEGEPPGAHISVMELT